MYNSMEKEKVGHSPVCFRAGVTQVVCLFLLCFFSTLGAQVDHIDFNHLSRGDGLSQDTTVCIPRDGKGFIWLGTEDGSHGLWIGTFGGGLNHLDLRTERFTHYVNNPDDGNLWFGTVGAGLFRRDRRSGEFTRYHTLPNDPASISSDNVLSLFEDRAGQLWAGTLVTETRQVDGEHGRFQEFSVSDQGPGIPEDRQRFLFDKYAQLHKDVHKKGTGLGLAVSRLIIKEHGGDIGYRPGKNGGSVFYFRLPCEKE